MTKRLDASTARFGPPYLVYAVGLLFTVNLLNVVDRMILGILINPIKQELLLTDTQLSLVSGFSFVLFYMVAGFAVSRRIDTGNRRLILTIGILTWSLATALTGWADGFWSLIVARVFVGAGEATAFPVAMSLIGDMFDKERRPRIVSIFQASNVCGVVGGSILAGALGLQYGWRVVFLLMGGAGVGVALINYLTLREPTREVLKAEDARNAMQVSSLPSAIRAVLRIPGFISLSIGYGLSYASLGMMASWAPSFLQRSHGLDIAQVGKVIGPAVGLGGLIGAITAGIVASKLVERSGDQRSGLKVTIFLLPFAAPLLALFLFSPSLPWALAGAALSNFCIASVLGPPIALAIGLSNSNTRAVGSTLMLSAQALLSGGMAPLVVGLASDLLQPSLGQEALRYAMTAAFVPPVIGALLFLHAYVRIGGGVGSGADAIAAPSRKELAEGAPTPVQSRA